MPCDCDSVGLDRMFGERVARHEARRFRKKGLAGRSLKLLDGVAAELDLDGVTALEVGAGVGALTISLLRRGGDRARIVDAVPAYVAAARRLAAEYGVEDSLEIELGDYVVRASDLPTVDVILMDRVVCCYPVWRDLLGPATAQAARVIALTYPRNVWWNRVGVALINLTNRLRRLAFRVHVHPPGEMQELLAGRGFRPRVVGVAGPWEILIATRARTG